MTEQPADNVVTEHSSADLDSQSGPLTQGRPDAVAVVIPAYNEAERLDATIHAASRIDRVDLIVVVDDGSTDATSAIAKGAGALVVRHKRNLGKAAAMATGARLVAMREDVSAAEGDDTFEETLHAEPRVPGHTGPLPVINPDPLPPRALLFIDADLQETAENAAPLVEAVCDRGVDMAIALLPTQSSRGGGFGLVVRTARSGIHRATGWQPEQPLSGTRCMTREVWDACQPLAAGWGVETSLSIDALAAGFWVQEVPCALQHRVTGRDLRSQVHRAAQLRDVVRALVSRRGRGPGNGSEPEAGRGLVPGADTHGPNTRGAGTETDSVLGDGPGSTPQHESREESGRPSGDGAGDGADEPKRS
ncbi:glycosyltransferase family 2 protein [Devriesea agamarum]|uniref:glycosyltransferase family 2 protein n=1 Tax=Devriesea agamarum TaxID=472569 RepID=UPI000A77AA06|nr:glycosyltransferase family 2 protein [Devriesea agamarum]